MKTFICFLMSSVTLASPVLGAETFSGERDEVLWASLLDLQKRSKVRRFEIGNDVILSVAALGGAYFGLSSNYAGRFKVRGTKDVRTLVGLSAALIAFLGISQRYVLTADRAKTLVPGRKFVGADRDLHVERKVLRELRHFLARPLAEQYEAASSDAGLREYLITLDEWLRAGVLVDAPPVAPNPR